MADFDVLCLQEVADNFPDLAGNGPENQVAAFARLLSGYTAVDGVALDISDDRGRRKRFGNMLLSRYPVQQVLRHLLPWEADATCNMPRVLIDATVMAPFGPVRVMTTHLEYSSGLIRRAQVEGIREAHRAACARLDRPREPGPGTYVVPPTSRSAILTGDFNMRPEDPTKQRLSEPFAKGTPALLDAWTINRPGIPHPPSFCLYDQTYGEPHCCDFIFVTEDLAARIISVDYNTATRASDHQPVLIDMQDE
jgi:endonuclease/exonuclease/phosphatase family metal-dependent hydrolase